MRNGRARSGFVGEHPDRLGPGVRPSAAEKRRLVVTAWAGTLLLSKLPQVIAVELLGVEIARIALVWALAAGVLLAATSIWAGLRPLRRYFAVMGLILLLGFVLDPWFRQSALWAEIEASRPPMMVLLLERVLLVLATLIVLAALLLTGTPRRELFLTVGDLAAPAGGQARRGDGEASPVVRSPGIGRKRRLTWAVLGPCTLLALGGLLFAFLRGQDPGAHWDLQAVIGWMPLILLSAALNAFGEEGMYRAAPLSALLPSVGSAHAIGLTAVWFGLGHYYGGIPSGLIGFVFTGLLAAWLGKAMLDTRGMGWPWMIHAALDSVIYIFLAAGAG